MSRELFDAMVDDPKSAVIIPGYMVKGTFSEVVGSTGTRGEKIATLSGDSKPFNIRVEVISFSAHSDYRQSSDLISSINPPNIVLIHGEAKMMADLKAKLISDKQIEEHRIQTPANTETVRFQFHGHKMVKIVGKLAEQELVKGQRLQGLLVRKDFDLNLVAPEDLPAYSTMKTSKVSQRQVLEYTGTFARLQMELTRAYEPGEEPVAAAGGAQKLEVMSHVTVSMGASEALKERLTLEWEASPVADAIVEHIIAIIADIELKPGPPPAQETESEAEVEGLQRAVKLDLLKEQFGDVTLDDATKVYTITFDDGGTAIVDDENQEIKCENQRNLDKLRYALRRIENALFPMPDYFEDGDYEGESGAEGDGEGGGAAAEAAEAKATRVAALTGEMSRAAVTGK